MKESCVHNTEGEGLCRKCKLIHSFDSALPKAKVKLHFSGPSPPEIFVGRMGYPTVNAGILAPPAYDTKHDELNAASSWSRNNLSIANVLRLRSQLIYGRSMTNIKKPNRLRHLINELALTHRRVSSEFFLKKQPRIADYSVSQVLKPMTNPAPIKKVMLEENTKVHRKVDYITGDTDLKAADGISELSGKIDIDHIQKILSAGLLGESRRRKMVPTRWAITATDDTISKKHLEDIRTYEEIDHIQLLEGNYLGNYIYILILPGKLAFEGIEVWEEEFNLEKEDNTVFAQDYEGFYGRKNYASNITGGYYAMRIGVTTYLSQIKRQAAVLVFREITQEYYAPLGVGVVREATKRAIENSPLLFETKKAALDHIRRSQKLRHEHLGRSWILENHGRQQSLKQFF